MKQIINFIFQTMKFLIATLVGFVIIQDIVCPPVQPDIKPVEGLPDDQAPEEEEDPVRF